MHPVWCVFVSVFNTAPISQWFCLDGCKKALLGKSRFLDLVLRSEPCTDCALPYKAPDGERHSPSVSKSLQDLLDKQQHGANLNGIGMYRFLAFSSLKQPTRCSDGCSCYEGCDQDRLKFPLKPCRLHQHSDQTRI